MNTPEVIAVKEYLKKYLKLEILEESYGHNGEHIVLKLMLDKEVLSEEYINTKRDDG